MKTKQNKMMKSLPSYKNKDDSSPELLAWCTYSGNKIQVVRLDGKQEEYANFEGASHSISINIKDIKF